MISLGLMGSGRLISMVPHLLVHAAVRDAVYLALSQPIDRYRERVVPRVGRHNACINNYSCWRAQANARAALRNMWVQGENPCQSGGHQLICTVLNARSGCGIRIVARPSAVLKAVRPSAEPFGLAG